MQGMRRDFRWPGCRRGLWTPTRGGSSLGVTLGGSPPGRVPPHHPIITPRHCHHRAFRLPQSGAAPGGQLGPWVHRVVHGLSPTSASGCGQLRHAQAGRVTVRAPTGPASPPCPEAVGARAALATPTPTAGAPRPGSLGFFPSLPSAFPSASNFSSFAKTNPQVSRAGAACGSARPARRGGLLPASILTRVQRRQRRRPRVPGADRRCLPARGGKGSYIDPRCRRARSRRPTRRRVGSHGGAGLGPPGSCRPARCRGNR